MSKINQYCQTYVSMKQKIITLYCLGFISSSQTFVVLGHADAKLNCYSNRTTHDKCGYLDIQSAVGLKKEIREHQNSLSFRV